MTDEKENLPDSAFENLTVKEKTAFTEALEKLAPMLKSKIIDAIRRDPSAKSMHNKVITTHEKDDPW